MARASAGRRPVVLTNALTSRTPSDSGIAHRSLSRRPSHRGYLGYVRTERDIIS
jgi:hypothetical protein